MNIHKNARTCPRSRALMVSRVLEEKRPVSEVAASMGVSRRTVYKWVQRYCAGGAAALEDGSRRAHHDQVGSIHPWIYPTRPDITAVTFCTVLPEKRVHVASARQARPW